MAKSPSVSIIERDMSTFTVTTSSTILAVVGYATKGPVGKATMVTSRTEFERVFGNPVKGFYSSLAVRRAFNQGNQIVFYRVADNTAEHSELIYNAGTVATSGYAEFLIEDAVTTTVNTDLTIIATVDGTPYEATFTGEFSYTREEIVVDLNTALGVNATAEYLGGRVRVTSATTGASSTVVLTGTLFGDSGDISVAGDPVDGEDDTTATSLQITVTSKEVGTATEKIGFYKTSRENLVTGDTIHTINILYDGNVIETFDDVSIDEDDDNYFVDVINAEPENGGSRLVSIEVDQNPLEDLEDTANPLSLAGGTDGIPMDGVNYDEDGANALFIDALDKEGDLANADEFDFHVLITPDHGTVSVQDAAIELAEFRQDFLYVVDPPFAKTSEQMISWHNGKLAPRNNILNSSYAALYWPWLKDFDTYSREYVWCPPSVFVAEKYMEVDRLFGPWHAPAGDTRGRVVAFDYEVSPSFPQRERIYGDQNAVNPFVNFSSKGLVIYGQKTLLRENSALNRVNTRRMVILIKKLVKRAMDSMLFEPHNPDTWRRAAGRITAILDPIRQDGGLAEYRVLIDNTTNTPDDIAQSIMKGIIKIVPTGTIEIINLSLQVNRSGSAIEE